MKTTPNYRSEFRILSKGRVGLFVSAALSSLLLTASIANAAPTGGVVSAGQATIKQIGSSGAITTNINQSSNKAIINWQSFSVGKSEVVNFNQPNSNSITLNRVIGNEQSVIQGMLNANGQVFLVNPNGVLISKEGSINTSGFLATTKSISDDNFMNSNYNFTTNDKSQSSSVINMGTINIANSGYAALIANQVTNSGTITAIKGQVRLIGADEVSINLNGNSLVSLTVNKSVLDALVDNQGAIYADGGQVYLTTNAANELLNSVVNNSGIIQARTIDDLTTNTALTGKIELFANGGTTNVSGTLDASAPTKGDGGSIETSGHTVNISDSAKITAKSANGTNGSWLIDPFDFYVAASGGNITGTALGSALGTSSVTIQTASGGTSCTNATCTAGSTGTNGDIYVNDAVSWSANNTLTLNSYRNIYINNVITASGASGKVALYYGQGALNSGNTATYDFGLTNTNNTNTNNNFTGQINLQAGANFSTKLGSDGTVKNYTVITDLGVATDALVGTNQTLQGIARAANVTGNFVLGANIDASATSTWNTNYGWTPIGSSTANMSYTGSFDGLGHSVSGLTINRSAGQKQGLFGVTLGGSSISNIGVGGSVTGNSSIGGLAGSVRGSVSNAYSTATVSSAYTSTVSAGGLIGTASNGASVSNSYATGAVTTTGGTAAGAVGGLIGYSSMGLSITNSYATGAVNSSGSIAGGLIGMAGNAIANSYVTITNCYATGAVTGYTYVGGLVGSAANGASDGVGGGYGGSISNSHATGAVTSTYASTSTAYAGGLVGQTYVPISSSYATGNVVAYGGRNVGGLAGDLQGPTTQGQAGSGAISDSYATGNVNDASHTASQYVGGLVGNISNQYATISNSHATGVVYGAANVGGLIGYASGLSSLDGSYATGNVISTGNYVGGVIGFIPTPTQPLTISNSYYSTGSVSGQSAVGGFVGYTGGSSGKTVTINNSYASGNVTATSYSNNSYAGGFVGNNYGYTTINNSYATGTVSGTGKGVGGFVGYNKSGVINNSYAAGAVNVTGTANTIGGFIGWNASTATITNAYSTGTVTGTTNIGGFVGSNDGTITNSFWDTQTSGQATGIGTDTGTATTLTGKTTAQMQTLTTYTSTTPSWTMTQDTSLGVIYPKLVNGAWVIGQTPSSGTTLSYTLNTISTGYTYNGTAQMPTTLSCCIPPSKI